MKWYMAVIQNYASFEGRARRAEFWNFHLWNLVIALIIFTLEVAINTILGPTTHGFLSIMYAVFVFLPSLAVGVRRLHDLNRSGAWMLLSIIPLANLLLLYWFLCEGEDCRNEYGSQPKAHRLA